MLTQREREARCRNYLEHLYEVFKFLVAQPTIAANCPEMLASCSGLETSLAAHKASPRSRKWELDLKPNWEIPVLPNPVHGVPVAAKLIIGGRIQVSDVPHIDQSINASILVTAVRQIRRNSNAHAEPLRPGERAIIRRFHFDYDTALTGNDRPRSHLQYGGKFLPSVVQTRSIRYSLFSGLEFPRIPFPPYDLVLTLDLFLRQFSTPLSDLIRENRWVNLVKQSERLWLRGYFEEIAVCLRQANRPVYSHLCEHVDWA